MNEPIIIPPPSEQQIKDAVDRLITPENADEEAKALAFLLLRTSGSEDRIQRDNMDIALRHAFTKTKEYERIVEPAFRAFIGYPQQIFHREKDTIELAGQPG